MRKTYILLLLFFLGSTIFTAQTNNKAIGVNGTISVPIGNFNDIAKIGVGISGTYFYELSTNFEAMGTVGFISWGGDKISVGNTSVEATESATTIPLLFGGRYYLDHNIFTPYITGELGMHIFSSSATKTVLAGVESDKIKGETNVYFGFRLGGGVKYQLDTSIFLDANLHYNTISAKKSIGHIALEIGFIIGI